MRQLQCLIILRFLVDISLSAKILCVFPVPVYSHQKVLRIFPEELAKLGHEVVVITPEPTGVPTENITEIDVRQISLAIFGECKLLEDVPIKPSDFIKGALKVSYLLAEAQINHPDFQKLINDHHKDFDLIIAEETPYTAVLFSAKFDTPIVLVGSCPSTSESLEILGSETNSLLFPYNQKTPETFWERISLFWEATKINSYIRNAKYQDDYLIKKYYGKDALTVAEVRKNMKMLILNVHHMWDNNRAIGPAMNYMGAIHLEKGIKPLPADLKKYLDNSKNGVVLMSFGTVKQNFDFSPHIMKIFINVFKSIPYEVIWKWNGGDLSNLPKNVRIQKWIPQASQADLLHHPAIKLYISHAGLQSIDEAIAANVPLIGLPLLGDQYHNAQKYKEYGIGIGMDIDSLDEDEFRRAILEIADNDTYRKNIHRLSRILSDRRVNGLQRALHQIQYLLDHGFPLQSPAANISFAEYFMLDVFGPIVAAVVIASVAIVCVLKRLLQ